MLRVLDAKTLARSGANPSGEPCVGPIDHRIDVQLHTELIKRNRSRAGGGGTRQIVVSRSPGP